VGSASAGKTAVSHTPASNSNAIFITLLGSLNTVIVLGLKI